MHIIKDWWNGLRCSYKKIGIRILRLYTMHSPMEKGKWRLEDLINRCAGSLSANHGFVIKSRDGRNFNVRIEDPQYRMGLLGVGDFEPEESAVVAQHVRPGDVVLDAGANFGWYTTLFSRLVGAKGQVHAFEPVPNTASNLEENCQLNAYTNVTVNHVALGHLEGSCRIGNLPNSPSGDASMFIPENSAEMTVNCRMTTLDKYIREKAITRCDFFKCDVEGAEVLVLKGAGEMLKKFRPTLLLEVHPGRLRDAGSSTLELLAEVNKHRGYTFTAIGKSGQRKIDPQSGDWFEQFAALNDFQTYVNVLALPDEKNEH